MAMENEGRVAVYIDFDNIVISRYNQLHGRGAFQSDRVRDIDPTVTRPATGKGSKSVDRIDAQLLERIAEAEVNIGAILDYASSFGPIVVSRAYADWSQRVNAGYRRQLVDRAIDLTQMFPLSATKNGADIRLAIDVVEDLFRLDDVTHVVLVAGDSDYVALAQRVKRLGRTIVAVGVSGATSRALPAACNDFSLYDDLPGFSSDALDDSDDADATPAPSEPQEAAGAVEALAGATALRDDAAAPADEKPSDPPATKGRASADRGTSRRSVRKADADATAAAAPAVAAIESVAAENDADENDADDGQATKMSARAATTLLRRALALGHDKNGDDWLHTSAVKQQIKRLDPSFREKTLGYGSFTDFVKSRSRIAELEKESNGQRVRLRSRRDDAAS